VVRAGPGQAREAGSDIIMVAFEYEKEGEIREDVSRQLAFARKSQDDWNSSYRRQ